MNKLFTLFTLLLLLPLAARAAANPITLTVGDTDVLNGGYWTTNADGTLTEASADNYNVYYDGNGTLTLKGATINGTSSSTVGAGIYAEGDLTIVLEGSSTVTGVVNPYGESQSIRVSGNLTIQGGGSLTAQGAETSSGSSYGIFVTGSFTQQSGSVTASGGNVNGTKNSTGLYVFGSTVTVEGGTLTATGDDASGNSYGICAKGTVTVGSAAVTATGGSGYASYGLYIESTSPSVTLSGGSLTARSGSATKTAGGIYIQNTYNTSGGSVTVGDNSTLLANSVILHDNSFTEKPLAPTGNGSWLIYGQSNQPSAVGGNYTLTDDLTIENGNTFTIPAGSTLTVPQGKTLTVNGTLNIANQSSLTGSGSLAGSGAFTLTNPDPVISGSDTLTYDGTDQSGKFTLTALTAPKVVMGKVFNISESPNFEGWIFIKPKIKDAGTYTLTVTNDTTTIVKKVTVSPATISITSATVQDKIYNGNQDATVTGVEFTGLVNSESLSLNTDYTATAVFGSANAGSQTATVTVALAGTVKNYTFASGGNTTTATAKIAPLPVELSWSTPTTFTYDGNLKTVIATVTNLVVGDEITLIYEGYTGTAVSSYTAKVIWLGNDNYTLEGVENTTLNWEIVGASIAEATVEQSEDEFTYTGSEQKPTVTVKLGDTPLTENIDYTVDYSDESINAGEYTVTVTGTGNYSGTATATYTITPAALTITGATLASKTYDGTTNATVESVTFNGLVNSESLTLNTDYTATAVFDDANAGTDKSATVTVTLSNGNYSLATSTYTLENQTIVQAVFGGTTEISGSVLANSSDEVKLPDIPDGASYGTPTSDAVTNMSITDGVLHYTGGSDITGGTYTITVPVTGATNYLDYNITVTLTGKEIVTVEAEGSKNPSFFTTQDRFTLTATVSGENLSENPDCWTWDIADKTVADFIDSPTTRSMSVSDSRTFEIKGPGTTTITATYDDGKYHGSVIFSVSISKPTPPDPISYYNIYVEDVCDGVEVTLSNNVVREGNSISVYVEKDTANYTFDNFHVYYKDGYYGPWKELPEGVQPGEYPIKNIWTHIYIKAEGAEEKEDPTGIEQIEGVKVYTKDGSLYVQTPQREQVIIVSMSGAVVKNEEQIGLKQYHGLQPGIYIVRVGDRAYKLRLH
ncbi:MAG: YDG domain-containing protein [Parabacteroides sp.]|nr:YDG domain-containing protein [Parabacteroides sp.]